MPHDTPSEHDKYLDLRRQYLTLKDGGSIFCPWCLKGNKPGETACCGLFTEGVARVGKEQFFSVQTQFRKIREGGRKHINCPYCGTTINRPDKEDHPADWVRPMVSFTCCTMLLNAITALVERETLDKLKAQKSRIEDKVVQVERN